MASEIERERAREVVERIRQAVRRGERVMLPRGDGSGVRIQPTAPYAGLWGDFLYQFEGEDDLLHLAIERRDGGEVSDEEGRAVALHLLPGVPVALIFQKSGRHSQHFYVGHEWLLTERSATAD